MKHKWFILIMVFIICLLPIINPILATNQESKIQTLHQENISFDLAIITTETYIDTIQTLVEHKNNIQIPTFVQTIEQIYDEYNGRDEAEKIKYFIQSAIEEFQIKYVLFIGGANIIPGRYTHIYFDEPFDYPTPAQWIFTSDFYYADIYDQNGNFSSWDSNNNDVFAEYHWHDNTDDIDLEPDIFLGRLACVNKEQVETCINKIIFYETNQLWSKEWFTNLVLIAGDGIPFDSENIDESEYLQEQIIEIMDGFIPIRIWASNGKLLDSMNINDAIENGAGFVFFNGHGLHDQWATYLHNTNRLVPPGAYRIEHINLLSNSEMLPIVISDACYHLQYNLHPDCFGWSFVSNPTGGAIAFIGGSDTDLAYAGSRIVEKGIEKLCLKMSSLYQQDPSTLGSLWGNGIIAYDPIKNDIVDLITITQNHLFGDPSLRITDASLPPLKPNPPLGPSSGKPNVDYEFSTTTIDPDNNEIYYLFNWDDNTSTNWIGPYASGTTCSITHSWNTKDSYQIRVKAKDSNGMQSEWSDPLNIILPKNRFYFKDILAYLLEKIPLTIHP
jgi:peptidase C25-like protein